MNSQELRTLLIIGTLALSGCSSVAGRLGYVKRNAGGSETRVATVAETAHEADVESSSFEDSVRHKIGLNVDYDLKVGTPQIDVGSMQAALKRYELQMVAFNQHAEAVRKRNELNLKLATEHQVRQILDGPNDAVHVEFWSDENDTADTHPQYEVPVLLHPDQPTLADLQLLVPITLQIGGDGALQDTIARRATKGEGCRVAPPRRVSTLESSESESDDSSTDDVPSFEDETDEPPFDDSVLDVLMPRQLEGTATVRETGKN